MTTRSRSLACVAILAGVLGAGCAPKHASSAPGGSGQTLVVLLQDTDTKTTGRAIVSNPAGSVDLAAERDSAVSRLTVKPGPVTTMSEAEIRRVFGAALSALPPAARHFTLYFRFESNELTEESRALFPEILDVVKQRSVPEVLVVGHTDTMGAPRTNVALGLNRATAVRNLLVTAGLDPDTVEVTSHGESDPLIKTSDETPEPRNRRVEISVR